MMVSMYPHLQPYHRSTWLELTNKLARGSTIPQPESNMTILT
jgi:hypothetical protein